MNLVYSILVILLPLNLAYAAALDNNSLAGHSSAWYLVRAAGLMAFIALYFSFLFGLAKRIPKLNKNPAFLIEMHKWLSLNAIVLVVVHAGGLIYDWYVNFSLSSILIPFSASYKPGLTGLGTISLYLILIIVLSSLLMRKINYRGWRFIHSLNILVYLFLIIHIYYLGTDLKVDLFRSIFIIANLVLVIFFLLNFYHRNKRLSPIAGPPASNYVDQT